MVKEESNEVQNLLHHIMEVLYLVFGYLVLHEIPSYIESKLSKATMPYKQLHNIIQDHVDRCSLPI